jgi:hypothetical protein
LRQNKLLPDSLQWQIDRHAIHFSIVYGGRVEAMEEIEAKNM